MLSLFPDVLTYNLLAPVIIRVVLGLTFIFFASHIFFKKRSSLFSKAVFKTPSMPKLIIGSVELLGGVLLIIGLFTQLVALVLAVLSLFFAYQKYRKGKNMRYYILLTCVSLSLFFSGAGLFAIDLPL